MRKFQSQIKPPRVKKYCPWYKRDGYFDVFNIVEEDGRMLIQGIFNEHLVTIAYPEKCAWSQESLVHTMNKGQFLEVGHV